MDPYETSNLGFGPLVSKFGAKNSTYRYNQKMKNFKNLQNMKIPALYQRASSSINLLASQKPFPSNLNSICQYQI